MKRLLSLIIAAALLLGLSASCAAEESFADSVAGQAFGVAMACFQYKRPNGGEASDELFAAEAAGWYAAWLHRTRGVDLLTEDEVRDFERAIGCEPERAVPRDWERSRVQTLFNADWTLNLDFTDHKAQLDDTLGQTLEMRIEDAGGHVVRLTLIRHLSDTRTASFPYELSFAPNDDAGSAFPWKLTGVKEPPAGPELDPALGFDWELLLAQNRVSTLLELYGSICFENEYAPDMPTWIFRRDGVNVAVTGDGVSYASGEYRGCSYVRETDEDGSLRTRVSYVGDSYDEEDWVTGWLADIAALKLTEIGDGALLAEGVTEWGTPLRLTLDYGTLALREIDYFTEEDERLNGTVIRYGEKLPDFSFLDAWDGPLRSVTAVWEDWYSGSRSVRTETIELPADWEYKPWDARWGDYTVYMNEGYTMPYAYPGDGVDYTLYLTTAKG